MTTPIEEYYYFDKNDKTCKIFESYNGGFNYNDNRFDSIELCHSYCGGFTNNIKTTDEACSLPVLSKNSYPDNNRGNLNVRRYAYMSNYNNCQSFEYGGIGGNDNNFKTIRECENLC